MRLEGFKAGSKRFRMPWAAALVLPVAVGLAAPAAAVPEFAYSSLTINTSSGASYRVPVRGAFLNSGANPRYTKATVSNEDYIEDHSFIEVETEADTFAVEIKTAAALSALDPPPSSPFTFTADVEMTNDEGKTASGTLTFSVTYTQVSASPPPPPAWTATETVAASAGQQIIFNAGDLFDNAGTNPRFTGFGGDATYIADHGFHPNKDVDESDRAFVTFKTAADLNAMSPPPPSPFEAEINVAMTNDEEQTASGTLTFSVTYARTTAQGGG